MVCSRVSNPRVRRRGNLEVIQKRRSLRNRKVDLAANIKVIRPGDDVEKVLGPFMNKDDKSDLHYILGSSEESSSSSDNIGKRLEFIRTPNVSCKKKNFEFQKKTNFKLNGSLVERTKDLVRSLPEDSLSSLRLAAVHSEQLFCYDKYDIESDDEDFISSCAESLKKKVSKSTSLKADFQNRRTPVPNLLTNVFPMMCEIMEKELNTSPIYTKWQCQRRFTSSDFKKSRNGLSDIIPRSRAIDLLLPVLLQFYSDSICDQSRCQGIPRSRDRRIPITRASKRAHVTAPLSDTVLAFLRDIVCRIYCYWAEKRARLTCSPLRCFHLLDPSLLDSATSLPTSKSTAVHRV